MHYGKIEALDTANGEGLRTTLFVSGCRRHCPGCFNPDTWDFNYGKEFTEDTIDWILELLRPTPVAGITLLGGEPFEPENQEDLLYLLSYVKEKYPEKNVWAYTGCTYERDLKPGVNSMYQTKFTADLLDKIDVLVDGEFIESKKNLVLKFRGSENQRIINLPKTLETGSVVLYME